LENNACILICLMEHKISWSSRKSIFSQKKYSLYLKPAFVYAQLESKMYVFEQNQNNKTQWNKGHHDFDLSGANMKRVGKTAYEMHVTCKKI